MKIGLISDIHADLNALKLALDILQGQGVDQIVCAGDLVDKGLDGDAVVKLIRERQIPCVMGNHDDAADRNNHWLYRNYGSNHAMILNEESLSFLLELPETLNFTWENHQVHIAHGTPWSNWEYVFPISKPAVFKTVLQVARAHIVILGHTHEPMQVKVGDAWILNPGSVCSPDVGGSHTCATLSLPDCTFTVFDLKTGNRVRPDYAEIS